MTPQVRAAVAIVILSIALAVLDDQRRERAVRRLRWEMRKACL